MLRKKFLIAVIFVLLATHLYSENYKLFQFHKYSASGKTELYSRQYYSNKVANLYSSSELAEEVNDNLRQELTDQRNYPIRKRDC